MLLKAELKHIDRLHHIGRQLSVLKRLYQSYDSIVDHVLEKQTATMASLANSHIVTANEGSEQLSSSQPQVIEEESLLGVSLSSAARVRFLRLKHRIRLFALSEIQDCLEQKESLVLMVSLLHTVSGDLLLISLPEFQSYSNQGVICSRTINENHASSWKGHDSFYASLSDERIFWRPIHGCELHSIQLLDFFCSHFHDIGDIAHHLRSGEWYHGG